MFQATQLSRAEMSLETILASPHTDSLLWPGIQSPKVDGQKRS